MEQIAIIADDLTGANDTGAQFCQHGFKTMVIIDVDTVADTLNLGGNNKDVWAINADTRHLTAREAYQRVYDLTEILKRAGIGHIYKKIDSTLRGHPGAELEAVMDAWEADLALVVPAFPANRRVVREGYLVIEEEQEVAATGMPAAGEEKTPICHIPAVLQQEMQRRVGQVNLTAVRQGIMALARTLESAKKENQVLVLDAVDNNDLQVIGQAIKLLPRGVVLAGAAGMAAHLTAAWDLKAIYQVSGVEPWASFSFTCPSNLKARQVPSDEAGKILLIAGSRNPVTADQVQRLAAIYCCRLVEVDTEAIIAGNAKAETERVLKAVAQAATKKDLLIVAVNSLFRQSPMNNGNGSAGAAIAATLGIITSKLLANKEIKSLVVTGGDTAVHVCRTLGARGINLVAELLPGIPLGYLEGGRAGGLPIVTKAGGFGPPDAFIKVLQYLSGSEDR
ncbi:four-carbon acid sugar kinase family protein [Moorella naiadis]|uniref:four-carbon acid sugar kinase family protein n=1 Tax=Moorella naiadis (nom. illeg.) TaxID=3093670 RepID=UPI003D9CBBEB